MVLKIKKHFRLSIGIKQNIFRTLDIDETWICKDIDSEQVNIDFGLQIDVNEVLFWMFFHRVNPNQVSHLRVSGDILLHRLTYVVGVQVSLHCVEILSFYVDHVFSLEDVV